MKKATQQMVEVPRGNSYYYLSLVEKQNDSGIMFNQRIIFLLSEHHIGYLNVGDMNESPKNVSFQKPKATILLTNIKTVSVNEKLLTIKYVVIESNKKSDRTWLFRMEYQKLAYRWYEVLQREKINSINRKEKSQEKVGSIVKSDYRPENRLSKVEPEKIPSKVEPERVEKSMKKEKKPFQIVHNVEVSTFTKRQRSVKQIGTSVSPKNSSMQMGNGKKDNERQLSKILGDSVTEKPDLRESSYQKRKDPNMLVLNQDELQSIEQDSPQKIMDDSRLEKSRSPYKNQNPMASRAERPFAKNNPNDSPIIAKDQSILLSKEINSSMNKKKEEMSLSNHKYLEDNNKSNSLEFSRDMLKSETKKIAESKDFDKLNASNNKINSSFEKELSLGSRGSQHFKQLSHEIPWTFKYIKHNYFIFNEFKQFTKQLMEGLVNNLRQSGGNKRYKPKLIKNGIYYFDIDDVQVKIATINLEEILVGQNQPKGEKVCNKNAVKFIQNQYNNFIALYQYLQNNDKLKVPLVSLCQYNGFVALFKVMSQNSTKPFNLAQIERQLSLLKVQSKIDHNFSYNLNKVIILLNEPYYQSLKTRDDEQLNFNCYFIQQIDEYLLPDLISEQSSQQLTIFRKQLTQMYGGEESNHKKTANKSSRKQNIDGSRWQVSKISKGILKSISEIVLSMNSLHSYFFNSSEFSSYLHEKGVNVRYLGHIYKHLTTVYQRRFVMTEIAVRSCKSLFRKTIQDTVYEEGKLSRQEIRFKVCDFMNCVLGNTYETAAIWKVLSTYSSVYFGVQLNFDQIDRGYFLISLIENCRLDVMWERLKGSEVFNSNIFFNQKNFKGLLTKQKTYPFIFSQQYHAVSKIIEKEETAAGFDKLVKDLNLKKYAIPDHLIQLKPKIDKYLSYFINPQKSTTECSHLGLFGSQEKVCPSRLVFDVLLTEIKWWLKLKNKQNYIRVCNDFINLVTRLYGQFHPIFSELYDIFSAYHLTCSEYEDAITFAKSSLVNILKILGTNHERTSECYYHLALCYIKAGRRDEAIAHIKKTKLIFESNGKSETVPYAVMSIKLGLLYLNQNQIDDCLNTTAHALQILQRTDLETQKQYQQQITECYEVLTRCFELTQSKLQMRQIAEQCSERLKNSKSANNIQRMLKIVLYPLFTQLTQEKASCYIDMISLMPQQSDENSYFTAFKLILNRIEEQSLMSSLGIYLEKLIAIQKRIRSEDILAQWINFKEIYERQTFRDFISLTAELIVFLGEGFLQGTLREAL